jgi:hypothetical protein
MAASSIAGGFDIDGSVADATADDAPMTPIEELAHRVITADRRGHGHASFTAASELLKQIARKHGYAVTIID